MNISDRIHNLRKAKGISQEELAGRIGVSRQAVLKWESEQSIPDIDKVITMSELLDVTTDFRAPPITACASDCESLCLGASFHL
jgi:transcriptional regulator with XRE-family HTH domain